MMQILTCGSRVSYSHLLNLAHPRHVALVVVVAMLDEIISNDFIDLVDDLECSPNVAHRESKMSGE